MTRKTRKLRKVLTLVACAVLLVSVSIMGTIAYLTSQTEAVKNTFTVGNVKITLDETDVDDSTPDKDRDVANTYKLIPGGVYTKDPIVHVEKGSEPAYVRMHVKVSDINALKSAFGNEYVVDDVFLLQNLVDWNAEAWLYEGYDAATSTYEFRYSSVTTLKTEDLPALFTKVIIPTDIDNVNLAKLQNIAIDITADAIQAAGFADADAAWAAFEAK